MQDENLTQQKDRRKVLHVVPMLDGIEEIKQDLIETNTDGDIVYGVEILDDYVETIRKGTITGITARPNTGKSLLSQIIANNIGKQGKKVLICSCEMGAGMLMERQILNLTGQSKYKLKQVYKYSQSQANFILDSVRKNNEYDYLNNIAVSQTGGATVYDLIDLFNNAPEYEYIVVDYVQRIRGKGTEYEVISNAVAELQAYARETGKRIILCSQGKRSGGKDGNTDAASQSKGSGSMEEDCDVGLLLSESDEDSEEKYILMILYKNRFGKKKITYKYKLTDRLDFILVDKTV